MEISINTLKVLIAEDHFLARQMIQNVMREKGVQDVHCASDGQLAREAIDEAQLSDKPFHIVFLDWQMPKITGIEILKLFRSQKEFNNTAFVMVTSVSAQKDVMDAVKSGATGYMIKPIAPISIAKKFDEIMLWLKQRP